MNCREYLIEFEERGILSEPATLHLTICTDCKQMSEQQSKVWLMIEGLNPISAPNDFDFRVKARIANGKSSNSQPNFLSALRYVLPIGIVVALIGLIAFNTNYFSNSQSNESSLAQTFTESKTAESTISANNASTSSSNTLAFTPSIKDKSIVLPPLNDEKSLPETSPNNRQSPRDNLRNEIAESSPKQKIIPPGRTAEENVGGGSRVSSVRPGESLLPNGITLTSNSTNVSEAQFLLSNNGIETFLENGRRTVKSLKPNSQGERLGVKVGDIIEKINANSISILRGSEKIEINLQNNLVQP